MKKLGSIILICVVSVVLIGLGKSMQETGKPNLAENSSKVDEITTQAPKAEQNNTADKVNINEGKQQDNSSPTKNTIPEKTKPTVNVNNKANEQPQQPQVKANITIVDTISGKIIIAKAQEFTGLSVADATCKLLDSVNISYKTSGFGDTIYFSSINGLRERGEGALSGWCFYVNGKKPSIGAGAYKLNKDDILEWKYLKDGSSSN